MQNPERLTTLIENEGELPAQAGRVEEFVRQFTRYQRKIHWYIFALLHDHHDTEEVFQETALVLWQKFDTFQPGTSFVAWACRVAHNKVLRFRDNHRRDVPCFSSVFLEEVAPELLAVIDTEASDVLHERLADCFARLSNQDRDLIERRYKPGATTKRVAAEVGRSTDAVYKALSRIHQALFDCMTASLAGGRQPAC
jgi:RNA polymerase sigma-70 factor (ECF subfamily)